MTNVWWENKSGREWVSVCLWWITPPSSHLYPDTDRDSWCYRGNIHDRLCLNAVCVRDRTKKGWLNTWLVSLKKGKRRVNPDKPDIWEDVGVSLTTDNSSIMVTLDFHTWVNSKVPQLFLNFTTKSPGKQNITLLTLFNETASKSPSLILVCVSPGVSVPHPELPHTHSHKHTPTSSEMH